MQENNLPETPKCSIHLPPGLLFSCPDYGNYSSHNIKYPEKSSMCPTEVFSTCKSARPKWLKCEVCGAHQQRAKHDLPRKRCSCLQKRVGWLTTPKVSLCARITHINMNIQHVY